MKHLLPLLALFLCSCQSEFNPFQSSAESKVLSEVFQLTHDFEKAGEAYFAPDMKWIIFQAVPKGETQYQMYVKKIAPKNETVTAADVPIRISPPNSRNT